MNKEDVNIRDISIKLSKSPPQSSITEISEELQDAENPAWSKLLNRIERIKTSLGQYFRAFKSYITPSGEGTDTKLMPKDKTYLITEFTKDFFHNDEIVDTLSGLNLCIENSTPSTSKKIADTDFTTELKENETNTGTESVNFRTENIILSDSDDDDSIVIAYLKNKNFTGDLVSVSTLKKLSVLEKVPKMETIREGEPFAAFQSASLTSNVQASQAVPTVVRDDKKDNEFLFLDSELSESSLDVYIPSFPGSPRSLNFGSGSSIELNNDPYFAEAIEFLHEDKEFLIAAETGNFKLLERLISKQANIQETDHLGRNALHLAVCSDSEDAVKLLLKYKVNINVKDKLGMTPLYLCLMRRPSYKIASLLFDHGAEIIPRSNSVDTGMFLQFVMMCTPTKEDASILELLVEKGAKVNDPDAPGGRQAIHFAAMSNNCSLIRILVQLGADLSLTNHRNETPINVAEIFNCNNAYELLTELQYNESENSSKSRSSVLVSIKLQ